MKWRSFRPESATLGKVRLSAYRGFSLDVLLCVSALGSLILPIGSSRVSCFDFHFVCVWIALVFFFAVRTLFFRRALTLVSLFVCTCSRSINYFDRVEASGWRWCGSVRENRGLRSHSP